MLAVIESHPVQYHAPVYRALAQDCGVPVTVIYGSDFSVAGYRDAEFGTAFAWDTDLLSGYASHFLSRTVDGGAASAADVRARGLADQLRAIKPSAVLVVGYGSRFDRAAWLEGWRSGAPLLFRGETNDTAIDRAAMKASLRRAALRVAYGRCAAMLYIGQRSREHFERLGVEQERLHFSPYCVDTGPFETSEAARDRMRGPARQSLGVSDDRLVVLFAGKLSERKGVDLLPPAITALAPELRRRITLLLVGDGALRHSVATAVDLDVRDVGFKNQRELSAFYHASDLLVLPSRFGETWGLVVNEALHHGVPALVSTRVGCAPDLIVEGVTGATCDPEASSLSQALARVLTTIAGRAETRRACRAQVASYSVAAAAKGIADAYGAVVPAPVGTR